MTISGNKMGSYRVYSVLQNDRGSIGRSMIIALAGLGFALALTATGTSAQARTKNQDTEAADLNPRPDIDLPVPKSTIDVSNYDPLPNAPVSNNFEITASNWAPTSLAADSQLSETGGFQAEGAQLSVNAWRSGWNTDYLNIAPKVGFSYLEISRNGITNLEGQNLLVTQVMNLYSLRLGLEFKAKHDFYGHLQPYADLSLLPTWAQAQTSPFSDGESQFDYALEEVAGLAWRTSKVAGWVGAKELGLEIGVTGTQGLNAALSGIGILAGTRIEL